MKNGLQIDSNGNKYWYLNDNLHREDGPAIEMKNSRKEWWINGQRHREDGPAIEYNYGSKDWWLENRIVYSKHQNHIHLFPNLSESFKKSIIKYKLTTFESP
jgi:hypothetical protein